MLTLAPGAAARAAQRGARRAVAASMGAHWRADRLLHGPCVNIFGRARNRAYFMAASRAEAADFDGPDLLGAWRGCLTGAAWARALDDFADARARRPDDRRAHGAAARAALRDHFAATVTDPPENA